MRTFGLIVLIAAGVCGGLYFGGYMNGNVKVEPTDKGKQAVTDVLNGTREVINNGLKSAAEKVNQGLEKAKVETAPQIKAPAEEPSK